MASLSVGLAEPRSGGSGNELIHRVSSITGVVKIRALSSGMDRMRGVNARVRHLSFHLLLVLLLLRLETFARFVLWRRRAGVGIFSSRKVFVARHRLHSRGNEPVRFAYVRIIEREKEMNTRGK